VGAAPLKSTLAVIAVIAATLAGGLLALDVYAADRELPVGTVRLSVEPGHPGALDVYVPLVDWGARFPAVRFPARLSVDVRTVDRAVVAQLARGADVDLASLRSAAAEAMVSFLLELLAVCAAAGFALGALTALAARGRGVAHPVVLVATAGATALGMAAALAILLPPRGPIDTPQYYAYGPDIPRALEALETVQQSTRALDQELDAQLVGIARLVVAPANRAQLTDDRPRLTVASDLHNNLLAVPVLEQVTARGPLFFVGDLTDRGSPLETELVRRTIGAGRPFVFVSGNHDSDALAQVLARDGAVVLTERGRLRANGSLGPVVNRVAGLRVAGYADPAERREADDFADRYRGPPTQPEQIAFADWLDGLRGTVDVVLVHQPELAAVALERLRLVPPQEPLLILTGHTHRSSLQRLERVTVVNAGSAGAGGTGNLTEGGDVGIARLIYASEPDFAPLAVDLVEIDPGTGSATAQRERLDEPLPTDSGS
jgi:predicted phosphodiesterase